MTLQLTKKHTFDSVFDSQKVFRLILDAMSNPSRIVNIKAYADRLYGNHTVFLAIAMTLLDNEVSFNNCASHLLSDEIVSLTLAKKVQIDHADFVFVCEPNDIKNVIVNAKCGTPSDPHKSATVIIKNDGDQVCRLLLSGPGIDGNTAIQATQTVKEAIISRDEQHYEYPQGIDLVFVSSDGELFAIPRLTRIEV